VVPVGGPFRVGGRTYGLRDIQFGGDNLQVPIFEGKLNKKDAGHDAKQHWRLPESQRTSFGGASIIPKPIWLLVSNDSSDTINFPILKIWTLLPQEAALLPSPCLLKAALRRVKPGERERRREGVIIFELAKLNNFGKTNKRKTKLPNYLVFCTIENHTPADQGAAMMIRENSMHSA
jgi:hypothetical protein